MRLLTTIFLFSYAFPAFTQSPAGSPKSRKQPAVIYTLQIDSSDLSGFDVSIRVRNAPHRFHLAMATHHEYDDRFWRYVTAFHAGPLASFTREDSAVWAVTTQGDDALVTYRVQLPPPGAYHFSHRPFLRGGDCPGGLVGDLHSFMYLVEDPHAACHLLLNLPAGWRAETGLDKALGHARVASGDDAPANPTAPMEFSADSAPALLDAPILVGHLRTWNFEIDGVGHEVVYLPSTPTLGFDTLAMVANLRHIVRACRDLFGGFPYRHFHFLLEDSCEGALEHGNSVTLGVRADEFTDPDSHIYEEIAHEFFHTWNLMAIRPAPYTDLNYGPQQASPGLWFGEGVTMLYADLICRRLGLPVDDSTPITHIESLITRYYADTGNSVLPPSRVSLASNLQPGPLGDYDASTHLQGELLGLCLDMLIRNSTDGRRSLDDVMKLIYKRFGLHEPLHDSDIEAAVTSVCQCGAAHPFCQNYLYQGRPIDFNASLHLKGLHLKHDQVPAIDKNGHPLPDTRVYPWVLRDDTSLRILITNPKSCWALAGLHTGDIIAAMNGRPLQNRQDFQRALAGIHINDTVIVDIRKSNETVPHIVIVSGYTRPLIKIVGDSNMTRKISVTLNSTRSSCYLHPCTNLQLQRKVRKMRTLSPNFGRISMNYYKEYNSCQTLKYSALTEIQTQVRILRTPKFLERVSRDPPAKAPNS